MFQRYVFPSTVFGHTCVNLGVVSQAAMVYFPGVVLSVGMSTNYQLSYKPIGKSAPLSTLHYIQLRSAPTPYPTKRSPFCAHSMSAASPGMLTCSDQRQFFYCQPVGPFFATFGIGTISCVDLVKCPGEPSYFHISCPKARPLGTKVFFCG